MPGQDLSGTLPGTPFAPTIDDLSEFGRVQLEQDYAEAHRRAKCGRDDFAAGWIMHAVRYRTWTAFTDEAADVLRGLYGSSIVR